MSGGMLQWSMQDSDHARPGRMHDKAGKQDAKPNFYNSRAATGSSDRYNCNDISRERP